MESPEEQIDQVLRLFYKTRENTASDAVDDGSVNIDMNLAYYQRLVELLDGLESLEIRNVSSNDEGANALARALNSNKLRLTSLSLVGNAFGPVGAVALATAVGQVTGLRSLTLVMSDIPQEDIHYDTDYTNCFKALAKALATVTGLTSLTLSTDRIREQGVEALVGALHCVPALATLNLGNIMIGFKNTQAFARALGKEQYGAMQRLFFTADHCIYVLVVDLSEEGAPKATIKERLDSIQAVAPG
ncbi:hypothetical protein KFL_001530175 [Klebsormidium nitens]|uniref:Uncharacterized protein n=1 Tax=Klebsormidium nitens TaxID=105231 RepID=A0A1Y1I4A2_KLENI|nr:hypothetical protein KFL_001530175 [Klebsormidium nitens]|eukprot:GAQ83577.1 hypothetical protein KFL_001530175 [Klebsormidium nitens]